MDAPTPVSPTVAQRTWYARSMGATLGAVLGLAAMGALYVASAIPAVESVIHIRAILDPDAFLGIGALLPPWAVAPIAAGLGGFICAPRTMAGRRWSGVAMGYVTYVIGILIAPLAVFGPPWIGSDPSFGYEPGLVDTLGNLVFGLPALSVIAGIVLAPLLLVCSAAGIAWAFGLRAILVAGGATVAAGEPERRAVDGQILFWIAVLLGIGWLMVGFPMLTLMGDPGLID
jgi:hypothetical protein